MPTLEHFAIYAADPHTLKDFYVDALGLRVIRDNHSGNPPGYFLADGRGTALEVIGRPAGEPGVVQRYVCHVAFRVADFAASRIDLERRGVEFEAGTEVDNPSMKTAFFDDPEGNRIQIVQRLQPLES